ncbi:endonuclease/exonuclease/phosphatase family protein [Crocosphaera sp.]|uniref:endonuclease/exonuclease/phosphatase family protein n=1 Tax=Crocosphaera sp. TaxID=2729996 RepID=UPI003F25AD4B
MKKLLKFLLLSVVFLLLIQSKALALTVVNWNVANRPNNTTEQLDMERVFQAIGRVDLLLVSETDSSSTFLTRTALNNAFNTNSYRFRTASADGGGDRTGLFYNSSTLSLVQVSQLTSGLTHPTLRGLFRPVGDGNDATDFYAYAIHLKSGSSNSDENMRASEASIIRIEADTLGNRNIIYGGDFNWNSSSEASPSAYNIFTSSGAGQANSFFSEGNWRDNTSFLTFHTNNPQGPMDDLFDTQLVSSELCDGVGLEITGAYRVLGNNGTHTLNQPITTGSGARDSVLLTLSQLSDHLPVVVDYYIVDKNSNRVLGNGNGSYCDR